MRFRHFIGTDPNGYPRMQGLIETDREVVATVRPYKSNHAPRWRADASEKDGDRTLAACRVTMWGALAAAMKLADRTVRS